MSAAAFSLPCPGCGFVMLKEDDEIALACPRCESSIHIELFPAFYRPEEAVRNQAVVANEASCFFHVDRVAEFTCSRCGRFLCGLCRITWAGEDVCQACIEAAASGQQANQLASSRFHYDSMALALSTLPVLAGVVTIISAPIALGFTLFTFNRECSVAPRTKIRFVLAIFCSIAIIAAWIAFFVYAFTGRKAEPPVLMR